MIVSSILLTLASRKQEEAAHEVHKDTDNFLVTVDMN
jgi:hypothetical protein